MSREHQGRARHHDHAPAEPATSGVDRRQLAQMQVLREFRQRLIDKATKAYPETVMQALLIDRQMLAADARELAAEKLDPEVGGRVGEKLLDKIKEKLVHGAGEALGLAEHFSGALFGAFEGVRGIVQEQVAARGQVTAIDVADAVINGAYRAMERYKTEVAEVIRAIPSGALLEARRQVLAAEGKAREADADDEVKDAVGEEAIERAVGLPQTGGARAHELAKLFYDEIRAQVRATKPVREQVDEIAELRANPNATEGKARKAEEAMSEEDGSGLSGNIKKDESARSAAKDVR